VLDYLLAALDLDAQESRVFEIGGPAQVSYGELMQQYARLSWRAWLEFEVTDNGEPAKTSVNIRGFRNPRAPNGNESIHDSERMGQSPSPSTQRCIIRQTALFDPIGLSGLAYWYLLYPIHRIVFAGLLRGLVRRAEAGR